MKASHTRRPLQQQAPEQKGPFFPKAKDDAAKKDEVFFQTKLAVGDKDDKQEKEADSVADKVQKKGEDKDKEPGKDNAGPVATGQKEASPDKSAAGQSAAAAQKDKASDKGSAGPKAEAQQKDKAPDKGAAGKDKEQGKGAAQQGSPKEEEQKMISRKEAEQDKEPVVQPMSDSDKKDEGKTKVNKKEASDGGDTVSVMREEAPAPAPAPLHPGAHKISLEERIKKSKGKGQSLPDEVRAFLEAELGADFSEVVIHTDSEAVAMNKELNALAFTNGFDIYFNAGQYRPNTTQGQKLLAHELTHVIQQTGVSKGKTKNKGNGK